MRHGFTPTADRPGQTRSVKAAPAVRAAELEVDEWHVAATALDELRHMAMASAPDQYVDAPPASSEAWEFVDVGTGVLQRRAAAFKGYTYTQSR